MHYCTLRNNQRFCWFCWSFLHALILLLLVEICSRGLDPGSGTARPRRRSSGAAAADEPPDVAVRWRNEPRKQEAAPHAIGIVFENRKGARFLAHGPLPVARPEAPPPPHPSSVFDTCWEKGSLLFGGGARHSESILRPGGESGSEPFGTFATVNRMDLI